MQGQNVEQTAPVRGRRRASSRRSMASASASKGPQGTATLRNPSDNSLAVGPDHVVQTVNSRMAIFTKQGRRYTETGRVLYGPVNTNNVFRGFGGTCEARNNGDAVVRYDQLARRWLIVMPIFARAAERADQPPVWTARAAVVREPHRHCESARQARGLSFSLHQHHQGCTRRRARQRQGRRKRQTSKGPYSICYAISTTDDPMGVVLPL